MTDVTKLFHGMEAKEIIMPLNLNNTNLLQCYLLSNIILFYNIIFIVQIWILAPRKN